MKVLNIMPFVRDRSGNIGIAEDGTFAAIAWRISDDAFKAINGNKFSWLAPDGNSYIDSKDNFSRPTAQQIIEGITPALKDIALKQELIAI